MKTINIDYKIRNSEKPNWLLYFVSDARINFETISNDDNLAYRLDRLSDLLNRRDFFLRKNKFPCKQIKREITDDKLQVYNTTGTKIILEISYK